jgi:hypothetical protein
MNIQDNLYIIKTSNSEGKILIKLGYSSNIKERINQYLLHNPLTEVLYTFYRQDAIFFEKWFHRNNISIYKNEWYNYDYLEKILFNIKNTEIINSFSKNKNKHKKPIIIIPVLEKHCYKCKNIKDSDFFHKNCWNKDGISDTCKEFMKKVNLKYRKR